MKWQTLRDMGLNIFKKRNRSRTIWVGGSLGVFSLFAWIVLLTGVSVDYTGDIYCEEECISYVNVTSTYWRICFADDFELVQTNPDIEVEVYVPARGKGNWRLFDHTKDCIERKNKYNVLPNRFKIVGHKEEWETVKWSVDKFDVDPMWIGVSAKEICKDVITKNNEIYYRWVNLTKSFPCNPLNISEKCFQYKNGTLYKNITNQILISSQKEVTTKVCEPIGAINNSGTIHYYKGKYCKLINDKIICHSNTGDGLYEWFNEECAKDGRHENCIEIDKTNNQVIFNPNAKLIAKQLPTK